MRILLHCKSSCRSNDDLSSASVRPEKRSALLCSGSNWRHLALAQDRRWNLGTSLPRSLVGLDMADWAYGTAVSGRFTRSNPRGIILSVMLVASPGSDHRQGWCRHSHSTFVCGSAPACRSGALAILYRDRRGVWLDSGGVPFDRSISYHARTYNVSVFFFFAAF